MGPAARAVAAVAVAVLLGGCGAAAGSGGPEGVDVSDGWSIEVVADGFVGPTQVVTTPEGDVWLAQLDGPEGAGDGQVLDLGPEGTGEPVVVLEDLLKPTGLAVLDDAVFVQEEQVVVRAPRDGGGVGEPVELPATALPFNGRSQGTLVILPDGRIAHESSGTGTGPTPAEGSGTVYAFDPTEGTAATPQPLAEGFKGPYAFVPFREGELLVGDMGDGTYDGEVPPGELNRLPLGDEVLPDGGWPLCIGDRVPVAENDGDTALCDSTLVPVTLFAPRASPTSIAVTGDGRVLVALWVEGRVVEVDPDTGDVTDVLTGVGRPQHLLALPDGDVLLTVHDRGELWRLTPP